MLWENKWQQWSLDWECHHFLNFHQDTRVKSFLVKLNTSIYRPHWEKKRRVMGVLERKLFMLRFTFHSETLRVKQVQVDFFVFVLFPSLTWKIDSFSFNFFFLLPLLLLKQPHRTPLVMVWLSAQEEEWLILRFLQQQQKKKGSNQ